MIYVTDVTKLTNYELASEARELASTRTWDHDRRRLIFNELISRGEKYDLWEQERTKNNAGPDSADDTGHPYRGFRS